MQKYWHGVWRQLIDLPSSAARIMMPARPGALEHNPVKRGWNHVPPAVPPWPPPAGLSTKKTTQCQKGKDRRPLTREGGARSHKVETKR